MLLRILLILCLSLVVVSVEGQSIESFRGNGRHPYAVDGEKIRYAKALKLLATVPETEELVKQAKTQQLITIPFAFTGSFLIGYDIASFGAGATEEDVFLSRPLRLGLGAAFIVFALTRQGKTNRLFAEAVDVYNQSLPGRSKGTKASLGPGNHGYGLVVRF